MTFLSSKIKTKLDTSPSQPPKQSPSLSHLTASSTSPSPSPTSSNSSVSSFFDSATGRYSGFSSDSRRESGCSNTSWGSMGDHMTSSMPSKVEVDMNGNQIPKEQAKPSSPPSGPSRIPSDKSIESVSSIQSGSSSSSAPLITTPEFTASSFEKNSPFLNGEHQSPPSGSTSSTPHSKGEATPKAERPPPIWPLASTSANVKRSDYCAEPLTMSTTDKEGEQVPSTVRKPSIKRNGSWRRKHASLDTPPTAPHLDPGFPGFTALSRTSPLSSPISPAHSLSVAPSTQPIPEGRLAPPTDSTPPDVRRSSGESFRSTGSGNSMSAQSPVTGCEISAPKPPPAGYPLPSLGMSGRRFSVPERFLSPSSTSTRTNTSIASSSSSSSSKQSVKSSTSVPPPPPRWACPPTKTNAVSGRALSFGSSQDKPDVSFDDFDPELFEGRENEWIEIIKGAEGRIAIKSTEKAYDIMVWLPGFSLDNITIATRGHRTVHIVADQWDEGDHAQWDIKLGEDANLKSVNAKFTGKELRVTVAREQRYTNPRLLRLHSERPPLSSTFSSPSITATSESSPLDRAAAPR
ncbi:uncharacterized protein IL334_004957 [Kwoniella shivajii]|uniref:SHSP domain-containing protein n=1 Tax=Kwoniella shivajii TaxID=564305 RepID=A0ABZ1D304_9TREE|nr:hypothetical protein IL334_004957 [Kwoniella shivajii]